MTGDRGSEGRRDKLWHCEACGFLAFMSMAHSKCERPLRLVEVQPASELERVEKRADENERKALANSDELVEGDLENRDLRRQLERVEGDATYLAIVTRRAHEILARHGLEGATAPEELAHWTAFGALNWLTGRLERVEGERDAERARVLEATDERLEQDDRLREERARAEAAESQIQRLGAGVREGDATELDDQQVGGKESAGKLRGGAETKYRCSACGEEGVPPNLKRCSVATEDPANRYDHKFSVPAHAVPVDPDCSTGKQVEAERCSCGRENCPWHMPDIDALAKAAAEIDAFNEVGVREWSELLLELLAAGYEINPCTDESRKDQAPDSGPGSGSSTPLGSPTPSRSEPRPGSTGSPSASTSRPASSCSSRGGEDGGGPEAPDPSVPPKFERGHVVIREGRTKAGRVRGWAWSDGQGWVYRVELPYGEFEHWPEHLLALPSELANRRPVPAPQHSHVEGEAPSHWDMPEIDALQRAAADIEALADAGIQEWSELLLELQAERWTLSRSTQQIDIQGLETALKDEAEHARNQRDAHHDEADAGAVDRVDGEVRALERAVELVREHLSGSEDPK